MDGYLGESLLYLSVPKVTTHPFLAGTVPFFRPVLAVPTFCKKRGVLRNVQGGGTGDVSPARGAGRACTGGRQGSGPLPNTIVCCQWESCY